MSVDERFEYRDISVHDGLRICVWKDNGQPFVKYSELCICALSTFLFGKHFRPASRQPDTVIIIMKNDALHNVVRQIERASRLPCGVSHKNIG
jgi:hypothetical protein